MALAVALAAGLAACTGAPVPSPEASCDGVDAGPLAGYYPALESMVPTALASATPAALNSGRSCSASSLGSLAGSGISDLHFAGAQFPAASPANAGVSLVIYAAPGLTADDLADAFTASANDTEGSVNQIHTTPLTIAGRSGIEIQVNNQDQLQTIVFWPAAVPDTVNAVLAAGLDDSAVQAAIAAFGSR